MTACFRACYNDPVGSVCAWRPHLGSEIVSVLWAVSMGHTASVPTVRLWRSGGSRDRDPTDGAQ
eukprot:3877381-Pyramimonas_sp.AAC.1